MVLVVAAFGAAVGVVEEVGEVHDVSGIAGVRVVDPFQVADAALGVALAAVDGFFHEGLGGFVWDEKGEAAGAAVGVGGGEGGAEIGLCGHVSDGVVDEDGVESAAEAEAAHVAWEVLAFGVE